MVCEPKDGPRCPLTNALNLKLKLRGPCGRQFAYSWNFALCLHSISRLYIEISDLTLPWKWDQLSDSEKQEPRCT